MGTRQSDVLLRGNFLVQDGAREGLHVAIIMDGNGRWATRRGLPRVAGHRAGVATVRRVVEHAPDLGIRWLTLYAFSSDNWTRPADEVESLEIGSDLVFAASLRHVAALQNLQHNLPLLFRGSLDSRLSRHSRLLAEAPSLTNFRVQFYWVHYIGIPFAI